jgi:hypothetical protein
VQWIHTTNRRSLIRMPRQLHGAVWLPMRSPAWPYAENHRERFVSKRQRSYISFDFGLIGNALSTDNYEIAASGDTTPLGSLNPGAGWKSRPEAYLGRFESHAEEKN